MAKKRELGPIPYGNCAIRDKIGNATVICSTDNIIGKSKEDFQPRYDRIQQIVYQNELAKHLREQQKAMEAATV